ncbi:MAG: primosomal protein N' [Bacillota bacterium]|nr:primosomal protein N' [Bacillota bacterium]
MRIAKVVLDNMNIAVDREFDYLVPEQFYDTALPGCRVLVPFGKGNATREGLILELVNDSKHDKLKNITAVIDEEPVISLELASLARFLKGRCFCTYYDVIKAILPVGVRVTLKKMYTLNRGMFSPVTDAEEITVLNLLRRRKSCDDEKLSSLAGFDVKPALKRLCKAGIVAESEQTVQNADDAYRKCAKLIVSSEEVAEYLSVSKNAKKHKKVLDILLSGDMVPVNELSYLAGVSNGVISTLEKYGMLETFDIEVLRTPYGSKSKTDTSELVLNEEQENAFNGLKNLYEEKKAAVSLLYGVTGSGKTHVYMKLIDYALNKGDNALLLVPEISLTPQVTDLFFARYGDIVAVMHSGMSAGERFDEWKRVRRGEARIVIGTRSAVFAPFDKLRLIIIDEEQEATYKSENSPRYHARDVAKFRIAKNNGLLLLCSATPSVESYAYAKNGRYHLFEMEKRYGGNGLPQVHIADLTREQKNGNNFLIGSLLQRELKKNLENGEQSIIFLNRRGYNTFVGCRSCGYVVMCPHCSISMTFHTANGMLMCHYCGHTEEVKTVCPSCGEANIRYFGAGTQRIEEELHHLLPDARTVRMDLDTTNYKMSHEKILGEFREGLYDILIGTQMVTKGLDIPNVTLVGVVLADLMLFSDDFRAAERSFSMLTQVFGRAGRAKRPGRAVVQTYNPENSVIGMAKRQDYKSFFKEEIAFRKLMKFPPFCDIYQISFVGTNEEEVKECAFKVNENIAEEFKVTQRKNVVLYNPSQSAIFKINNKYRYKILIKCRGDETLRAFLHNLQTSFYKESRYKDVSMLIDFNPQIIL